MPATATYDEVEILFRVDDGRIISPEIIPTPSGAFDLEYRLSKNGKVLDKDEHLNMLCSRNSIEVIQEGITLGAF